MNQEKWIDRAVKLLKAIKFNKKNPSHDREVIGGHEMLILDELLGEVT